ncbi:3,4-dihydroxy-2-butanone-4-phosphate synthase [Peribacillus sp. SCS-155]|uniref:3,4-dihydroxy-2-butanone-4-phosphate synthase n=1 Tax=Peribacillus sedimenti TaxID=3115297 RepID=UPI003905A76E
MFNTIEEALEDLKAGRAVIVVDDEDRENEGDFVVLAEKATPEAINFMATHGRGLICTTITEELASKLDLHPMVDNNTDNHSTAFTVSIDHRNTTTGISAFERSTTILELLNDKSVPSDFRRPGHIFPIVAKEGGVLRRAGHTEASVDLAILSGAAPAGVICEIMKEDGSMARVPDLIEIAKKHDLKLITIAELIRFQHKHETLVKREVETAFPTPFGEFNLVAYSNPLDSREHLALVKGNWSYDEPVLVRVHSECLTGDVFGSYHCECGPQLHAALSQIEQEGKGVLVYMRQQKRGHSLLNKLKADKEGQGVDNSYEKPEFPAELRDYGLGAQILRDLGVRNMRLLTNNPKKISGLTGYGLEIIETVPIQIPFEKEASETKHSKTGHLF